DEPTAALGPAETKLVADLVLLATGYRISFPFLADLAPLNWQVATGAPQLFMNIFPPGDNNLFVAGLLEGAGVGWAGRALQTDLIAAWLTARDRNLPAAAAFRRRIEAYCATPPSAARGDHGIFVDFLQYKRDLQRAIASLS
ncbi:hypothetical protein QWY95_22815, partial [Halomonas neptunia]|nr:hypothetical protein [Halomonas neptunia]